MQAGSKYLARPDAGNSPRRIRTLARASNSIRFSHAISASLYNNDDSRASPNADHDAVLSLSLLTYAPPVLQLGNLLLCRVESARLVLIVDLGEIT